MQFVGGLPGNSTTTGEHRIRSLRPRLKHDLWCRPTINYGVGNTTRFCDTMRPTCLDNNNRWSNKFDERPHCHLVTTLGEFVRTLPHVTHCSLGPYESTPSKTASWSVQPFLQSTSVWRTHTQTQITLRVTFDAIGHICAIHTTRPDNNNNNNNNGGEKIMPFVDGHFGPFL